tara:strand:+ start:4139 stop:4702 length:564 start_codon:yes stop_codon:yes gene_type:complete
MKRRPSVPGEKLAVAEEFEGRDGTYLADGVVRSQVMGEAIYEMTDRTITVTARRSLTKLPRPGDVVIGTVDTATPNVVNMTIQNINGNPTEGGFTGMLLLDQNRSSGRGGRRKKLPCKASDVLKAAVVSNKNAIIHLSISEEQYGVIRASCSFCGGLFKASRGQVECTRCGGFEERKLAATYGVESI